MDKISFSEIKRWKYRVINYYRKHRALNEYVCGWKWATYKDMIRALSFMKHELKKDQFTAIDYEELIRG